MTLHYGSFAHVIAHALELASATGRRQKIRWSRGRRCWMIRDTDLMDVPEKARI